MRIRYCPSLTQPILIHEIHTPAFLWPTGNGADPQCNARYVRRSTRIRSPKPSRWYHRLTRFRLTAQPPAAATLKSVGSQALFRSRMWSHKTAYFCQTLPILRGPTKPRQEADPRTAHLKGSMKQLVNSQRRVGLGLFSAAPPTACARRARERPPAISAGYSLLPAVEVDAIHSSPYGRSSSRHTSSARQSPITDRHPRWGFRSQSGVGHRPFAFR